MGNFASIPNSKDLERPTERRRSRSPWPAAAFENDRLRRALTQHVSALIDGRLKVSAIAGVASAIDDIRGSNLGVDLRAKAPEAVELCGCPWEEDEQRRWNRYKRR